MDDSAMIPVYSFAVVLASLIYLRSKKHVCPFIRLCEKWRYLFLLLRLGTKKVCNSGGKVPIKTFDRLCLPRSKHTTDDSPSTHPIQQLININYPPFQSEKAWQNITTSAFKNDVHTWNSMFYLTPVSPYCRRTMPTGGEAEALCEASLCFLIVNDVKASIDLGSHKTARQHQVLSHVSTELEGLEGLPDRVLMFVRRDPVSVLMEYGQTREVKVSFTDIIRSGPHHASR